MFFEFYYMNKIVLGISILSVISLLGACSNGFEESSNNGGVSNSGPKEVVFTVKDFERDNISRTNLEVTESGVNFTWAPNDTVGVFPSQGDQVSFIMQAGAGTESALFNGGSWGLKESSTYYAYYPFSRKYFNGQSSDSNIWVNYKGQSQVGNNNTSTTGNYDFLCATGLTPEDERLLFQFEHLGAMVQIVVKSTERIDIRKISLATENEEFMIDGYYNLKDEYPVYVPVKKSKTISLATKNLVCDANTMAVGYMMVPPTNLTGKSLTIRVYDELNRMYSYKYSVAGEFKAGKIYSLKAAVTPSTENPDEIYDKMELSCNMDAYLKDNSNLGENLNVSVFADFYNEGELLMKPFVADKNGNMNYSGGTMYLPQDHDLTLYAIYGRLANWNENELMPAVYKYTVRNEQSEANYFENDLMYAANKVTSDGNNSEILFSHVCSGIRIGIKAAPEASLLAEKQVDVTLNNLYISGNLNMKTGDLSPATDTSKGIIDLGKVNFVNSFGDTDIYAKATVIPQKLERGTELITIRNGNKVFKYTIDKLNGLTLEPGKIHTFEIEIDGDSNISVTTSIAEWEVGETIIID